MPKAWEIYEQAARGVIADLRDQLGIVEVEGKQELIGQSGAVWEIDGKAVLEGDAGFLVIEARRHTTSGQKQEALAALAYRICDVDGAGGVIVSPIKLQSGAEVIATHEKIHHVRLAEWSTAENYLAEFMGTAFGRASERSGVSFSDHLKITVFREGKVIDSGP